MASKEFERGEPNRRSIRLKPNKLEVVTLGELPPLSSPQPTRVIVRNLRNEQQHSNNHPQVDIRDGYSLKLSDITGSSASSSSGSATVVPEDQSLSVLQTLERQINTMEFDTRMKQERSAEPLEPKKERPVHYGELPSLLNTGLSDVAGNGFGYMDKAGSDSDENLNPSSFKRGEDSRSSTGGAIGSASTYARKLKTTRTVNRTVSDSKNAENTAKLLRQKKPPAPRPPMIIPTTSPPQITKLIPKDAQQRPIPSTNSSASSMASSTGSSSIAAAATSSAKPPVPSSGVKNATERKISSEILKHVVGPQKAQVTTAKIGRRSVVHDKVSADKV